MEPMEPMEPMGPMGPVGPVVNILDTSFPTVIFQNFRDFGVPLSRGCFAHAATKPGCNGRATARLRDFGVPLSGGCFAHAASIISRTTVRLRDFGVSLSGSFGGFFGDTPSPPSPPIVFRQLRDFGVPLSRTVFRNGYALSQPPDSETLESS